MSNTKQLPPELVEKMSKVRMIGNTRIPLNSANECAQIAVDFAEEEIRSFVNEFIEPIKTRIDMLYSQAKEYVQDGRIDLAKERRAKAKTLQLVIENIKQLLKEHEDGD